MKEETQNRRFGESLISTTCVSLRSYSTSASCFGGDVNVPCSHLYIDATYTLLSSNSTRVNTIDAGKYDDRDATAAEKKYEAGKIFTCYYDPRLQHDSSSSLTYVPIWRYPHIRRRHARHRGSI
eukprot:TRINITY_DN10231_c0_g1_i1.p1 TRINITY_DN10231_c0_g1~~TRINITY_DN10231_c0_g1_i1.p1  ORF type:complete len:124 (+),score=8.46 TRINITY_DN10231_c0_g1_i1:204-575(+)